MDRLDDRYRKSSIRNEGLDILKTDKELREALLEVLQTDMLRTDSANCKLSMNSKAT